jgi:hypothetical protein
VEPYRIEWSERHHRIKLPEGLDEASSPGSSSTMSGMTKFDHAVKAGAST